ncbi:patatin-like phospholipase family protein [Anaeromyxobacter paludicola]|uniref:PNPLA domain-containing protein n=1 Tax=Anaeromyxobacter paludicola TaxID=2918171 RepID=A0ABN6N258_9BACT|nr:patatin-like phospholipase family protein [Anaeromyxobacter paludicola]BDG07287.1 hypothetical protein AMPC_04000 [Anaeromyxobacter paludicola]
MVAPILEAIAAAAWLATGGVAADGAAQAADDTLSVSLTVSGGVSLGTYEAGLLSYAMEAVQRSPGASLPLLTGASAGSLNALLAVIAACGPERPAEPTGSLFWRTWIPVGFDQLFVDPPATPLGVFSRQWLDRGAARIEEAWNRGLDRSCDVVLGISATRARPRRLRAAGGRLELPSMEEKFALRIQGRGPGRPPRVTNYPVPNLWPAALLVTDEAGEVGFAALRDLVFASMSFPIAFPPQPLRTCAAGETARPGLCLESEARTAPYVDGGVFDNAPLRLAAGLARVGLQRLPGSGRLSWRDVPDPGVRDVPRDLALGFIDPDSAEYPAPRVAELTPDDGSLPRHVQDLLAAFVDTARSKELATLLEEQPGVADRIVLPTRHYPAAGAPIAAFLGFFETEFRVFDFHLGMYDASRMLAGGVHTPEGRVVAPPVAGAAARGGEGWRRFACMRAVFDGEPGAADACRGDALADFRVLLQVSLDELYSACARRPKAGAGDGAAWRNPRCEAAARGEPPPRVPGVTPAEPPDWRRQEAEPELAYALRLLSGYGFRFADLRVPPGREDLALARIRHELGRAARSLAAVQPGPRQGEVAFLSKLAADALAYSPPDHALHVTMGPAESEVGFSHGIRQDLLRTRLALSAAAGFRGLEGVFSSGAAAPFAGLLTAGIEAQPLGNSALSQFRFGLRGGWSFASGDDYGAGHCDVAASSSVSACSRPVVQALVGLTALERFRMQLVGEWFPGVGGRSTAWSLAPGIGLELGF